MQIVCKRKKHLQQNLLQVLQYQSDRVRIQT